MLFHSNIYLFLFLPIVCALYFISYKQIFFDKRIILILSGIIFYSWWNIYLTLVIIFSIIFNYRLSLRIIKTNDLIRKKFFLFCGILFNIIYLGIFKYTDFVISNINAFLGTDIDLLNLPFPLALSFVTFQTIAFLVDCYDENIEKFKNSFVNYSLFIIFFPQLISGPIVKFNYMIDQFNTKKNKYINMNNIILGLVIILIGFCKKIFIADYLSIIVDQGFSDYKYLSFFESWLVTICFTFQLYFDFSGYIDMATGSALIFNILLPKNFNSPFKATSLISFWQRWHITLYEFLMNYIYFPILKNLKEINFLKAMIATFIVFAISGLWHGPTWGYILFGCMHGIGMIINHIFKKIDILKLNNLIAWSITFLYVNLTLVFFRSPTLHHAYEIIKSMFGFKSFNFIFTIELNKLSLLALILAIVISFGFKNVHYLIEKNYNK